MVPCFWITEEKKRMAKYFLKRKQTLKNEWKVKEWKQLGVNATWFKVKSVIEMSTVLHLCSPVAHAKRKGM